MKPKVPTDFTRRLLTTAAAVIGLAPVAFAQDSGAQAADPQTFFVLNNPQDTMFNQLLGINQAHVIVGYFGDGNETANVGYVLVPRNHYSNYVPGLTFFLPPPSGATTSQIQAIGINENSALAGQTPFPDIVGFYTDATATHGFLDSNGNQFTIDDPMGVNKINKPVQNLLGLNNALRAAGFWTDNAQPTPNQHGFVVEINTNSTPIATNFVEFSPAMASPMAIGTQTSNITNNNLVCGFWVDANLMDHGFTVMFNAQAHRFNLVNQLTPNSNAPTNPLLPNVISLSPFGCNDHGAVVGSYIVKNGDVHGFVFDGADWHNYDAAGFSQTAAFDVKGTVINGINNDGNIVGFFSDGTNVNGFLDFTPVP
jgi:hypothetical protein